MVRGPDRLLGKVLVALPPELDDHGIRAFLLEIKGVHLARTCFAYVWSIAYICSFMT